MSVDIQMEAFCTQLGEHRSEVWAPGEALGVIDGTGSDWVIGSLPHKNKKHSAPLKTGEEHVHVIPAS